MTLAVLAERLVKPVYNRAVRPYLPRRVGISGGVAVRRYRYLDRGHCTETAKAALIDAASTYTRPGDAVGVIGGDWCLSAAVHARRVMPDGSVTVYDPSPQSMNRCRDTLDLNAVGDVVELVEAAVGPPKRLDAYGASDEAPRINPADLPEFDVLELDCEGAEVVILGELRYQPRVLIVEYHPPFGAARPVVRSLLEDLGYHEVIDLETCDSAMPAVVAM